MPPEKKEKAKHVPTALLVDLPDSEANLLRSVSRQFSIESEAATGDVAKIVNKRKFEACVLRLDDGAQAVLEAVRGSARNRSIPILGICSSAQQAIRYSKLGINAILHDPLERQDVMRGVRSAHLLIIHELRRYVRIPIVLEFTMDLFGGGKISGLTRDVSYGGMSVVSPTRISVDHAGEVSFILPTGASVKVGVTVLWRHEPELVGLRFETGDDRRLQIRPWVDEYLKLA